MNEQPQPGPTPQPGQPGMPGQKKGMSTGCIVALIVVGVLIALVVIAGIVCYAKRDDLVKFGGVQIAEQMKKTVAENPQPGVDTAAVNGALNSFIERTQAAEQPDMQAIGQFIQNTQHVVGDDMVDSLEAVQIINAVNNVYPSAVDAPSEQIPADTAMMDTTAAETM